MATYTTIEWLLEGDRVVHDCLQSIHYPNSRMQPTWLFTYLYVSRTKSNFTLEQNRTFLSLYILNLLILRFIYNRRAYTENIGSSFYHCEAARCRSSTNVLERH